GYSADVIAAIGGRADRLAPWRASTARCCRRRRRTVVGGISGDDVCVALHRCFTAVRGDLVHAGHRTGHRDRRAGRIEGAAVLTRQATTPPMARSAACGGSAAPAARSRPAA